jgi:hypothetical protein
MMRNSVISVVEFYRYTSNPSELELWHRSRLVRSTNVAQRGATWLTPDRYEDASEAQRRLALRHLPTHRIGPIPAHKVPVFDIDLRTVAPDNGHPGLGRECRTLVAIWLFGLWDFNASDWVGL